LLSPAEPPSLGGEPECRHRQPMTLRHSMLRGPWIKEACPGHVTGFRRSAAKRVSSALQRDCHAQHLREEASISLLSQSLRHELEHVGETPHGRPSQQEHHHRYICEPVGIPCSPEATIDRPQSHSQRLLCPPRPRHGCPHHRHTLDHAPLPSHAPHGARKRAGEAGKTPAATASSASRTLGRTEDPGLRSEQPRHQ
jgi:hypothetical protein